jgi:DNA-binding Xre family transcriptional regulator|tara:strand:- start:4461 stop:4679 length:219 start_codon:yes stop_codon:yes gene_type:complete
MISGGSTMYRTNLKNILDIKNISQIELSKEVNLNYNFINALATGRLKSIKISSLHSICKFLDVDITEIIYFK